MSERQILDDAAQSKAHFLT